MSSQAQEPKKAPILQVGGDDDAVAAAGAKVAAQPDPTPQEKARTALGRLSRGVLWRWASIATHGGLDVAATRDELVKALEESGWEALFTLCRACPAVVLVLSNEGGEDGDGDPLLVIAEVKVRNAAKAWCKQEDEDAAERHRSYALKIMTRLEKEMSTSFREGAWHFEREQSSLHPNLPFSAASLLSRYDYGVLAKVCSDAVAALYHKTLRGEALSEKEGLLLDKKLLPTMLKALQTPLQSCWKGSTPGINVHLIYLRDHAKLIVKRFTETLRSDMMDVNVPATYDVQLPIESKAIVMYIAGYGLGAAARAYKKCNSSLRAALLEHTITEAEARTQGLPLSQMQRRHGGKKTVLTFVSKPVLDMLCAVEEICAYWSSASFITFFLGEWNEKVFQMCDGNVKVNGLRLALNENAELAATMSKIIMKYYLNARARDIAKSYREVVMRGGKGEVSIRTQLKSARMVKAERRKEGEKARERED